MQADVGRDDADQSERRKVQPLGDHLCADQDVGVRAELVEQPRVITDARGRVAVHAHDARARKEIRDDFDDALRSDPELTNRTCAALGALQRNRLLIVALVTAQQSLGTMDGQRNGAIRTAWNSTA